MANKHMKVWKIVSRKINFRKQTCPNVFTKNKLEMDKRLKAITSSSSSSSSYEMCYDEDSFGDSRKKQKISN
jgi:hypothetical protein